MELLKRIMRFLLSSISFQLLVGYLPIIISENSGKTERFYDFLNVITKQLIKKSKKNRVCKFCFRTILYMMFVYAAGNLLVAITAIPPLGLPGR